MSLLVGQTVANVATGDSGYTGPQVGVAMALFGGIIAAAIGFIRLGILVDFIPEPAIGKLSVLLIFALVHKEYLY